MARLARASSHFTTMTGVGDFSNLVIAYGEAAFGKNLKSATNFAMTPVLKKAIANGTFDGHDYANTGHSLKYGGHGIRVFPGYGRTQIKKKSYLSRDKNLAETYVGVTKRAFYLVAWIERGSPKHAAQPFLKPAFLSSKRVMTQRLGDKLSKNIEKEIKRRNARAGG